MDIIPKRIIDEIQALQKTVNMLEANTVILENKLTKANAEIENLLNRLYPKSNKVSEPMEKL